AAGAPMKTTSVEGMGGRGRVKHHKYREDVDIQLSRHGFLRLILTYRDRARFTQRDAGCGGFLTMTYSTTSPALSVPSVRSVDFHRAVLVSTRVRTLVAVATRPSGSTPADLMTH